MTALTQSKTLRSAATFDLKKTQAKNAKHFLTALKKFLKDAGLSRQDLAATTGVKDRTLRSWLFEGHVPSEENMAKVRSALRAKAQAARRFAEGVAASGLLAVVFLSAPHCNPNWGRSATGVSPYLVCLADGGLPLSGTNPALVGE